MKKAELAQALAEALNLLNNVIVSQDVELTNSQKNSLYDMLAKLPENVSDDYLNNWEVNTQDLAK